MKWVVSAVACLLLMGSGPAIRNAAAQDAASPSTVDEHGMPQTEGSTLHLRGFTDINYAETDQNSTVPSGFTIGQFVLHMSASLGKKVSFFGETSFTARARCTPRKSNG